MANQPSGLFQQLYLATKPAHRELEHNLSLLQKPVTADRIRQALERFLGFHLGWEPGFVKSEIFAPVMRDRGRSGFAAADLEALGLSQDEIAALPICKDAANLHRSAPIAMGSIYVMEGSTLGGDVIAKALRAEAWAPARGLQYFSPPDRQARKNWTELEDWAESRFAPETWAMVEQGAQETFALMNTWHSNR